MSAGLDTRIRIDGSSLRTSSVSDLFSLRAGSSPEGNGQIRFLVQTFLCQAFRSQLENAVTDFQRPYHIRFGKELDVIIIVFINKHKGIPCQAVVDLHAEHPPVLVIDQAFLEVVEEIFRLAFLSG